MSRVHILGVVKKDDDGNLRVLISCSETPETWKFKLRGSVVVLEHGRPGSECGTLFSDARTLAEGELHKAARVAREIEASGSENVVKIEHSRRRGFGPGHSGPDRATAIFDK